MDFKIGEEVVFLFESGSGIIRKIERGTYFIEDETGFERPFKIGDFAKIHGRDYKLPDDEVLQITENDSLEEIRHYVKKENRTGYLKPIDVWEIDLHIEEHLDSHAHLSNAQILAKQMAIFKSFYKDARAKHIRKLVVIHGVGEGVLKDEVRLFLHNKDGVEYFDANYQEYGKGATAIEIHYNWSE